MTFEGRKKKFLVVHCRLNRLLKSLSLAYCRTTHNYKKQCLITFHSMRFLAQQHHGSPMNKPRCHLVHRTRISQGKLNLLRISVELAASHLTQDIQITWTSMEMRICNMMVIARPVHSDIQNSSKR